MIYELVGGAFPFPLTSMEAVKSWHLARTRDLSALRDAQAANIVQRALQFDLNARWQSAAEMQKAVLGTVTA